MDYKRIWGVEELPRIVVKPPGPKAREILERDKRVMSPSLTRMYPLVVESAKGSVVKDVDGNLYIDFTSGISVLNVGHARDEIVDAIRKQAEKFTHFAGMDFYYEVQVSLAERLIEITPGNFEKRVFYANSGAEANEAAFKLARWHTRRQYMLSFIGCFHGRTFGALSLTAQRVRHRERFSPLVPGVVHTPYADCYHCRFKLEYPECDLWCVRFIEDVILRSVIPPDELAGIIVEPIVGGGGIIVPPEEFHRELRRICDETGALYIVDEIHTGFARTGKMFAIEHFGVEPDVITMAKAIASGIPLGAMVARAEVMDWVYGSHASTFGGNAVACAAALANIEVIERENLVERSRELGEKALAYLRDIMDECRLIGDVRGKGLMIGVELVEDKKSKKPAIKQTEYVVNSLFERGLLLMTAGPNVLRIIPPLTIEEDLLFKGLEMIRDAIKEAEGLS